jgi:leucyl aminopeptidase (aminopeptidase T)
MRFERNLLLLLGIKPWERVLVLCDDRMEAVANKVFSAIKDEARVEKYVMPVRKRDGEEPTPTAAARMLEADVVIAVTKFSITHTKAVRKAIEKGVRVASMPGLDKRTLTEGGLTADYSLVMQTTSNLLSVLSGCRLVTVTAKNGTSVSFSVESRAWHKDEGNLTKRGSLGNLPAGEVFIAPVEESIEGRIVFDFFPLAKTKLVCEVKAGKAVSIRDDIDSLERIFKELGENSRQIAEFGIGTNYKAMLTGILEGEKILGTCHFALGSNIHFGGKNDVPFHADGLIYNPTIEADGKTIMKSGKLLIEK